MKAFYRVRWFSNATAVLFVGLLSFSSQLEQLITLSWFRLIVTIMDQLKYELLCLVLISLSWPQILRVSKKILVQIIEHYRAGRYVRLAVWLSILAVGLGVGIYQLVWYSFGKSQIYMTRYENKLLMRANTEFENGNVEQVRRILKGCDYVLLPADCKTASTQLEARLARADAIVKEYKDEPRWSNVWFYLPKAVYEFDHRASRRTDLNNQVTQFYTTVKADYFEAVISAEQQEWHKAKAQFTKISSRFPWFGDAARINAEIDQRIISREDYKTPLLIALQHLGAEEFSRVMTNPWMLDERLP